MNMSQESTRLNQDRSLYKHEFTDKGTLIADLRKSLNEIE